ncbi:MAG: DUF2029 domain-containing protein [Actinobacteria bacterium]|nr:MAG: DUF2029 domain-containing protein [Actinomycetota bacterium]
MRDRRGSVWNAVLYLSSAVFAGVAALAAAVPIYREWGRIASIAYTAGTVGALALVVGRGSERARAWLAILVLAGAAILPLGLEVAWRARTDPGFHAQSEAIVTEEAAKALLHGRDPYVADYLHGPLRARPLGTRTHFPYLPAMLVFGLPRGLSGDAAAADARVAFAVATLSIAGAAMWLARQGGSDPWGAFLFLVVLPTGALLMATGGDDLPVLASMFLAVVLAWRERIVGAGVAAGLAAAMKQTAWPLLLFLAVAIWRGRGGKDVARFLGAAAAVAVPVVLPFVVWNPAAFVEDVVRFPLGLGHQPTPAGTPTLGHAIVAAFPSARTPLTATLAAVIAACGLLLLLWRPARSIGAATARTAAAVAVAFLLAPAGRAGYLVYPIELLVWARMLAGPGPERSATHGEPDARQDPRVERPMIGRHELGP